MKIAIIAPTPIPFLIGGAEKFFWGLQRAINQYTPHDAELIKISCDGRTFWSLIEGCRRFQELDLTYFDAVISTKDPAWLTSHPQHHLYLQHRCRGVYDLYPDKLATTFKRAPLPGLAALYRLLREDAQPTPQDLLDELDALPQSLRENPVFAFPGPLTRGIIHALDHAASGLSSIKSFSAISANVAHRQNYFPADVPVSVIHHPTDLEGLRTGSGRIIFTASRLESLKRVDLLINAFKKVKTDVEFKIAGTGGQFESLKKLAAGDSRIKFLGFISDSQVVDLYAESLFVPFVPFDEDYGLITLEAMQSGKPVLTVHDGGGVTELVRDGINGLITEPQPAALAAAMRKLLENPEKTVSMGLQAQKDTAHIDWPNTVEKLFVALATPPPSALIAGLTPKPSVSTSPITAAPKPKMVVANTFPVGVPVSGGQKRIFHIFKELAAAWDVVLISLDPSGSPAQTRELAAGFTERTVPVSQEFSRAELELHQKLKASVGDIAAIDNWRLVPAFIEALKKESQIATLLVAAHPYLYYALREVSDKPLWYDAHNVEYDMKAAILPPTAARDAAREKVFALEKACLDDAFLVTAVSAADRDRFLELYDTSTPIHLAANGMDFSAAPPRLDPVARQALKKRLFGNRDIPTAVFIGSNHGPNVEALMTIKKMAEKSPATLFLLIGSVCEAPAAAVLPANVKALGVLDEATKMQVMAAADLALNPVVSGSGSNLKILEYMACGLPVISTPCGIRGYAFNEEKHLFVGSVSVFPDLLTEILTFDCQALNIRSVEAGRYAAERNDWLNIVADIMLQLRP